MRDGVLAMGESLSVFVGAVRSRLVTRPALGPAPVQVLTEAVGSSPPPGAQPRRVPRGARLITAKAAARERIYTLGEEHLAQIVADAVRHSVE